MSKSDEYMSVWLFSINIDQYMYIHTPMSIKIVKFKMASVGVHSYSTRICIHQQLIYALSTWVLALDPYFFFFKTWFRLWNDFYILHHIKLSVSFRSSMNLYCIVFQKNSLRCNMRYCTLTFRWKKISLVLFDFVSGVL